MVDRGDLGRWIVRQWKRRGIVASVEEALRYFDGKNEQWRKVVTHRMRSGWEAPKA